MRTPKFLILMFTFCIKLMVHKPVLLKESVKSLKLKKGDIAVDATLGGGGHGREILKKIGDTGILIGIDTDITALKNFAEFPISPPEADPPLAGKFQIPIFKIKNLYLINSNFSNLRDVLENLKTCLPVGRVNKVNAIIADFGLSSDQIENAERGFSFQKDGPLDMRMDQSQDLSAERVVNNYDQSQLEKILREYGDEQYAKRIAENIIRARKIRPIKTTRQLVEIIEKSVPNTYKHRRIHFATKTFLALRMEVNDELTSIRMFLSQAVDVLEKKSRLAVISFHSGEDRLVKNFFRENAGGCVCPKEFPICICGGKPKIKIITKKPIMPGKAEIRTNPRSRSAKLRVAEKI